MFPIGTNLTQADCTSPHQQGSKNEAETILATYPPDRVRSQTACATEIDEAMKEEITPED